MRPGMMIYFERVNRAAGRLPDAQFGAVMKGLLQYAQTGEELNSDDIAVQLTFDLIRDDIDADARRYEEIVEKRRQAGRAAHDKEQMPANADKSRQMPANADKSQPIPIPVPLSVPVSTTNAIPVDGKRDKPRTPTRFKPPTLQEVTDYCKERGNRIDPAHFIDFYEAKGWKVGNTPMKDWKAAIRTWEQRDRTGTSFTGSTPKVNPALQYSQREYTREEANNVYTSLDDDL